jgi:hypothetical protein
LSACGAFELLERGFQSRLHAPDQREFRPGTCRPRVVARAPSWRRRSSGEGPSSGKCAVRSAMGAPHVPDSTALSRWIPVNASTLVADCRCHFSPRFTTRNSPLSFSDEVESCKIVYFALLRPALDSTAVRQTISSVLVHGCCCGPPHNIDGSCHIDCRSRGSNLWDQLRNRPHASMPGSRPALAGASRLSWASNSCRGMDVDLSVTCAFSLVWVDHRPVNWTALIPIPRDDQA